MATRTLPSELEIQREVEALRDIRRRSVAPGALTIDPDLPPNPSPPSPSQSYRHSAPPDDGDSSSSSHEGSSIPRRRSSRTSNGSASDHPSAAIDDPFHLFWVPASLHPEIAPAEFRAFLKEHARAPPPSDEAAPLRSDSASGLARRKSMLSRQYLPSENDEVEDEKIFPLTRNRSNLLPNRGPQLTIKDLEKLEQLAEEASSSDDPSKFRNILRRSLSLNLSPSAALSHMAEMPDIADEADSPIIVPPPGQILRRAARTKIRKLGLPGDGGGHRFASTRKAKRAATAPLEPRTSSDRSSSDHGESVESVLATPEQIATSRDRVTQRPESYSEETFIIDSYARDDDEELHPPKVSSPELAIIDLPEPTVSPPLPPSTAPQLPIPETLFEALDPVLYTAPFQLPEPAPEPVQIPLPISPPEVPPPLVPQVEPTPIPIQQPVPQPPQPVFSIPATPSPPPQQRKDKDKKGGLFGKWGSDKASKKAQKNASSEKETGFFGSLFGGSKKKQESEPISSTTGRETAQALLGASKSKNHIPPTSPGLPPGVPPNNYSRYPIHVERAIYRLSHIKLANPRRPLYEQVLISNLMFWYLGVINKAQNPTQQPNGQPVPNVGAGQPTAQSVDAENQERDQMERERAEREHLEERERLEREQRERVEREAEMKKESGRRGSLTKSPPPSGGGRRAEKPIKGPQYEMQHRVMEQEYATPNGRLSGRSLSATAVPSPPMYQVNGRARKGASAYASIPLQGKRARSSEDLPDENGFEEEDVPLAVWQQQKRR